MDRYYLASFSLLVLYIRARLRELPRKPVYMCIIRKRAWESVLSESDE
jgi:hypothetical protein